MQRSSKKTVKSLFVLSTSLLLFVVSFFHPQNVFGRENNFVPAIGEILSSIPGPERSGIGIDGKLTLYSYQGDIVSGFPVALPNGIFISSPLLVNVLGDSNNEIVVLGRNSQGTTSLYIYNSLGNQVGNISLGNIDVYFDPIAVYPESSSFADIFVVSQEGQLKKVSLVGGVLQEEDVFQFNTPVGISFDTQSDEFIVNFPLESHISMYTLQSGNFSLNRELQIESPALYPVRVYQGNYVFVARDNKLYSVNRLNASNLSGFPVHVGSPSGSVIFQTHSEEKIGVPLINGGMIFVSQMGEILENTVKKNLLKHSVFSPDILSNGIFSSLRGKNQLYVNNTSLLSSIFSNIRFPFENLGQIIAVQVEGQDIQNASQYHATPIGVGSSQNIHITFKNIGSNQIIFSNTPIFSITPNNGQDFEIIKQPKAFLEVGETTDAIVRFSSQTLGEQSIVWQVSSNDSQAPTFSSTLFGQAINNLLVDGSMEEENVDAWRAYAKPPVREKSTQEFFSGAKSIHFTSNALVGQSGGIQQLAIPVLAGHWYRVSFQYKVNEGTLYPRLGIKSSNGDFEVINSELESTAGQWVKYTRNFKVPDDFVSDFRFVLHSRDADVYIDDAIMEEIEDPLLIKDGDMSASHINNWVNWGNPTLLEKRFEGINSVLYMASPDGGAGVQQINVPTENGKWYKLSFRYKHNGERLRPVLNVHDINRQGDFEGIYRDLSPTDVWKTYERLFQMPTDAQSSLTVRFTLRYGEVYLDDVVLVEIPKPEIVRDGDMESSTLDNWRDYGSSDIREKRLDSGDKYLFVEDLDDAGGVSQGDIHLNAATTYKLSFRYKFQGERFRPLINIRSISKQGDFEGIYQNLRETGQEWGTYERIFNTPEGLNENITLFATIRSGSLWLDDVVLEEVSGG